MPTYRRVYVIVSQCWGYNDEWWSGDDRPVVAFTDRHHAEEHLARRKAEAALDPIQAVGSLDYVLVEMDVTE
jgi:hypothetical protein